MGLVVSTCVGDESVLAIMLGSNHVISSEPALGSAVASWGLVVSTCVGDESVLADMLARTIVEHSDSAVPSAATSWRWWCRCASRMGACWLICSARNPYTFLAAST
ncbi:hypothetical protein MRX96_009896 [Rhipicephalus microplus]